MAAPPLPTHRSRLRSGPRLAAPSAGRGVWAGRVAGMAAFQCGSLHGLSRVERSRRAWWLSRVRRGGCARCQEARTPARVTLGARWEAIISLRLEGPERMREWLGLRSVEVRPQTGWDRA